VGLRGLEPLTSSLSGQIAEVAACGQLGAEQCEWSAQVQGCPAVCAAIVTRLDTQSRPEAVLLALGTRLRRPPVGSLDFACSPAGPRSLDEAGQNMRPPKARTRARRGHTPVVRVPARAPDGYRRPGWSASGLARGAACSTGCASTGDARASAAACPKPITPA
jgi:hypothetical protein